MDRKEEMVREETKELIRAKAICALIEVYPYYDEEQGKRFTKEQRDQIAEKISDIYSFGATRYFVASDHGRPKLGSRMTNGDLPTFGLIAKAMLVDGLTIEELFDTDDPLTIESAYDDLSTAFFESSFAYWYTLDHANGATYDTGDIVVSADDDDEDASAE